MTPPLPAPSVRRPPARVPAPSHLPCPLRPEDVVIQIVLDAGMTALDQRIASMVDEHSVIVEHSFLVVPMDSRGRPLRRLVRHMNIDLEDIRFHVNVSDAEMLFYSNRILNQTELERIGAWLAANYSLGALQRTSVRIVQELNAATIDRQDATAERLEQRALVVAEATGMRAAADADSDAHIPSQGRMFGGGTTGAGTGNGLRRVSAGGRRAARGGASTRDEGKRRRRSKLLEERQTMEDTLAQFEAKIAMFALEDPETAEMLMPAKLDLQMKLRGLQAELAAYGGDVGSVVEKASQRADNGRAPYVPSEPLLAEYDSNDSTEDEEDLRQARRMGGSECELTSALPRTTSGRTDYVSSESNLSRESSCEFVSGCRRREEQSAQFVIDLAGADDSASDGSAASGDERHSRFGSPQNIKQASHSPHDTRNVERSPTMKSDFQYRRADLQDDSEDCSDLERDAEKNKLRRRGGGR